MQLAKGRKQASRLYVKYKHVSMKWQNSKCQLKY